jgi:hypothetical protein
VARREPRGPVVAMVTFNHVPRDPVTFKYDRLGAMALENRRQYCQRHDLPFLDRVPRVDDRPICWGKIPALLAALADHEWVMWADSDALILSPELGVARFCNPRFDLVVQDMSAAFTAGGLDPVRMRAEMPLNTGVFLARSTPWVRVFLEESYAQEQWIRRGPVWDGVGEQEAMNGLLRARPSELRRISFVDGLQAHPLHHRPGNLFVHFYGDRARHLIAPLRSEEVMRRWEEAIWRGLPSPSDLARLHWCAIQHRTPSADDAVHRGPERFGYAPDAFTEGEPA